MGFLYELESIINKRIENKIESSYSYQLFTNGIDKSAQKTGEEAIELIIEAMKKNNINRFIDEASDLLYHLFVLLKSKGVVLKDIEKRLFQRNKSNLKIKLHL